MLDAALLGIVQGLTEFLPISSSAHLILARAVLGWDADRFGLAFDVACHVGTLLAVVAYFREDLLAMTAAAPRMLTGAGDDAARALRLVAVGTLPIVGVGLAFDSLIEERLRVPLVAALMLAVGAIGLIVAERLGRRDRDERTIGAGEALAIGFAQAAALVPGVSRSGATITLGLLFGLRRDAAARFSFLLGVPAVAAAAAKEGLALLGEPITGAVWGTFAVGLVTSAGVGYVTVKYFLRYLAGHTLDGFAYYRLGLAAVVPVWWMLR